MGIKIGINGFGRIGRVVTRIIIDRNDGVFDICAINLRKFDLDQMVYQLKYDSTFGPLKNVEISHDNKDHLIINGKQIKVFGEEDPANIKWGEAGVEYLVESTGKFLTRDKVQPHLDAGAKKVILSAPAKEKENPIPTFVCGVNLETYTKDMTIISNASCTTNCLAPLTKVINDNFGIENALMSTIHASTSKQHTVDSRDKDWRIGRSIYNNIIPTTTGAAKAVALVIPSLKGKITGMAYRIPASDVSVVDLTVALKNGATYEEICAAVKKASENEFKGIIRYSDEDLVSTDFVGEYASSVFDAKAGISLNDKFVKLVAWYDNEWGYSANILKLIEHMNKVDHE